MGTKFQTVSIFIRPKKQQTFFSFPLLTSFDVLFDERIPSLILPFLLFSRSPPIFFSPDTFWGGSDKRRGGTKKRRRSGTRGRKKLLPVCPLFSFEGGRRLQQWRQKRKGGIAFFFFLFYLRRSRHVIERWELLLLLGGDYFEVMTSEVDQTKGQGQLFLDVQYPLPFPPKIFFGVGSVGINQNLLLPDHISLRGGIRRDQSRSVAHWPNFSSRWDILFSFKWSFATFSCFYKGTFCVYYVFLYLGNAAGLWTKSVLVSFGKRKESEALRKAAVVGRLVGSVVLSWGGRGKSKIRQCFQNVYGFWLSVPRSCLILFILYCYLIKHIRRIPYWKKSLDGRDCPSTLLLVSSFFPAGGTDPLAVNASRQDEKEQKLWMPPFPLSIVVVPVTRDFAVLRSSVPPLWPRTDDKKT